MRACIGSGSKTLGVRKLQGVWACKWCGLFTRLLAGAHCVLMILIYFREGNENTTINIWIIKPVDVLGDGL